MSLIIRWRRLGGACLPGQRGAAGSAELEAWGILTPTLRAAVLEGRAAFPAKLHLLRIVKTTAWATHACIPLGAASATLIEALIVTGRTSTVGMVGLLCLVVGGAVRLRRQRMTHIGVCPTCRRRIAEQASNAGMFLPHGEGFQAGQESGLMTNREHTTTLTRTCGMADGSISARSIGVSPVRGSRRSRRYVSPCERRWRNSM